MAISISQPYKIVKVTYNPGSVSASRNDLFSQEMTIEISKEARADAIASMKRYVKENMSEPVGDLAASLLLNYFLEEIGPLIYNRAIADAQERLQRRVLDLNGELYAEEFQYWFKLDKKRKSRG